MSISEDIGQFYTPVKQLGKGTFSEVVLCHHKITNEKVAVKVLDKASIQTEEDFERMSREIQIMRRIRHPNCIQLYEIHESNKFLYFIMEYPDGGELYDRIVENQRLQEPETAHYFHQLILAIDYLATVGISHRDIKPENILLDANRDIKLIDFGLGKPYTQGEQIKTACGSPCYAAPEMVARKYYKGEQVDIWSSGITLFAMLCGIHFVT